MSKTADMTWRDRIAQGMLRTEIEVTIENPSFPEKFDFDLRWQSEHELWRAYADKALDIIRDPAGADALVERLEGMGSWIDHLPLTHTQEYINLCDEAATTLAAYRQQIARLDDERYAYRAAAFDRQGRSAREARWIDMAIASGKRACNWNPNMDEAPKTAPDFSTGALEILAWGCQSRNVRTPATDYEGEAMNTAQEIMERALDADIKRMLDDLGNPPLVARIFPGGWEGAPFDKRRELHDLCIRTYRAKSKKP